MTRQEIQRLADEELMSLVDGKDAIAFEAFFDRHGGAAYSLAHRIVGDRAAAEDVAQEAFLSIWRSRAGYDRARGSVRAWVLGIVRNRAIDALRRDARPGVPQLDFDDDAVLEARPAEERTDAEAVRRETAREVRGALDELPERSVEGDPARLLRRLQPLGDRRDAEHAAGHGEGADAPRAGKDARENGGAAMNEMPGNEHPTDDLAAYALGRARTRRGGERPRAPRQLRALPRRAELARARGRRAARLGAADRPARGRSSAS